MNGTNKSFLYSEIPRRFSQAREISGGSYMKVSSIEKGFNMRLKSIGSVP